MRAWKGREAMETRKGHRDETLRCSYSTYKFQTRTGPFKHSICIPGVSGPGTL